MSTPAAPNVIFPVPLSALVTRSSGHGACAPPHAGFRRAFSTLDDQAIRAALREEALLSGQRASARNDTYVQAEEVPILGGHVRADLMRVSVHAVHVLEIKSDLDGRGRLAEQARVYSQIADEVTLVVGRRHLAWALGAAPEWWEVVQAAFGANGTVELAPISPRRRNPKATRLDQLALLSRSALSASLAKIGVFTSPRDPLSALRSLALACLTAPEVRLAFANQLTMRGRSDRATGARLATLPPLRWTEQPTFL
ncbi:MAG: hypothetical protein C0497_12945 [Gemmatimonas sp.]|nr:hypothetical protein [Gemmatimonas sp.]